MTGIEFRGWFTAQIGKSSQDVGRQRAWATAAAGLVIVCVASWLAFEIPKGILTNTDELLTAERTREMLLTNPWVVHFNFQRSFQKPPLQYWLTTLTLPRFENRTLAVRIWPAVYAVLTAVAAVWLAFLIDPTRPWLMPLAVAILVSCPLFSSQAGRGLLDIGLAFYTTIAIVFAQLARRHPAWWLGVAVACWLGSVQKIPLIFLVWLLIVIVRLSSASEPREKSGSSAWLIISVILAIVATATWPWVQMIKYHMPARNVFHEEVTVLLGPESLGRRPYLEIPFRLSVTAWIVGGPFAFVAPFTVLLWKRQGFSAAAKEIAMLCIALITLAVLFNFRSVRYTVPIIPSLCLLLAVVLHRFFEQRSSIRIGAAVLLGLILTAGVTQAQLQMYFRQRNISETIEYGKIKLHLDEKNVADEKRVAEELGTLQDAGTQTVLIKAKKPGGDLLWDSFYLFHGNLRFPVANYTVDQIRQDPTKPPLIGVCVARDFPVIQEVYPMVQVQFTRAQFICWRVSTQ